MTTAAMPLYRKIKNDIKGQIDSGKLNAGDKIPSVNNITQLYGVSPITAVRVFKELNRENYARHEKGKGYFVTACQDKNFSRKLHGVIACMIRPYRPTTTYDNYFNEINAGIQQECMKHNYDTLYPSSSFVLKNPNLSPQAVSEIEKNIVSIAKRVDGLILDERIPDSTLALVSQKLNIPCAMVFRKTKVAGVKSFVPAYKPGLEKAMEMALKSTYENFIMCRSYARHSTIVDAMDGAHKTLANAGVPEAKITVIENCFAKGFDMIEAITDVYNKALKAKKGRTLIVCASDSISRYACDELISKGFSFNNKLGIIGVGGMAYSTMKIPKVATVDTKAFDLGANAVEWVFKEVNQQWEPADKIKPEFEIKLGQTF